MKRSRLTAGLAVIFVFAAPSFAADDAITLPAGSELDVELITTLSSKTNDAGDFWTAKVIQPVFGKGGEVVPEGSTVDGHITYVKDPSQKKEKDKGEMRLIADSISMRDGSKYNIVANLEKAEEPKVKDEGTGFMATMARRFSKKGKDTVLTPGTEVSFAISRDTMANKVPVKPESSSK